MSGVRRFEDLIAWQKGRALVSSVYRITDQPPFSKDFALIQQIRRAVIAIPSNVAEGFERSRPREFHQFLSVAKSSCAEVRTQLYLASDVGYLTEADLARLLKECNDVATTIGALRASVARRHQLSTQHSAPSTV